MRLSTNYLALFILVPILVDSNPQLFENNQVGNFQQRVMNHQRSFKNNQRNFMNNQRNFMNNQRNFMNNQQRVGTNQQPSPTRNTKGTPVCQFPFIYKNIIYSGCTTANDPKGQPWCSTKTDNRSNHLKGNWAHCIVKVQDTLFPDEIVEKEPRHHGRNLDERTIFTNNAHHATMQGNKRNPGCTVRPDPGECRGAFTRFYYNETMDQCDCFLYGGCDEKGVEFTWLTLRECVTTCVPGNTSKGPRCNRMTLEELHQFMRF